MRFLGAVVRLGGCFWVGRTCGGKPGRRLPIAEAGLYNLSQYSKEIPP
jgi:hypothetical protein